jgi:TRAP-type uncharacterized transport system fused permease subunit
MFIYNPTMLPIDPTGLAVTAKDFPPPPIVDINTVVVTSITGVIAWRCAEGYFRGGMNTLTRVILVVGALHDFTPEIVTGVAGAVIVLALLYLILRRVKHRRRP